MSREDEDREQGQQEDDPRGLYPGPGLCCAPEKARRKEALEDYPLDSIAMVGYLNQKGVPVALVTNSGLLYQVKVGNYLGQNYGRILAITDTGMTLREIVQDAAGEWIEKETNLQIQEAPAAARSGTGK